MTKPVSMEKKYRTRDGRNVRVLLLDWEHDEYPVVAVMKDQVVVYTAQGKYYSNSQESSFDLIEVSQWDFPIDTPVLVRDYDNEVWNKRYFSGVNKEGKPTAFERGVTSFSAEPNVRKVTWEQCIKANV